MSQSTSLANPLALHAEEIALNNGATLLYRHMPSAPRLAFSFFVKGGNLVDTIPGMSDMTERLLLKGTKKRSQEQISIELDGMTLELETDTKRDFTVIHATLLDEDLDAAFDLINDIFYNATFAELDREKQKMAGEITMSLDSPKSRASDQFIRALFQESQYGVASSMILENISKFSDSGTLQAHARQVFTPENLVIAVVGNISADKAATYIQKAFPATGQNVLVPSPEQEASVRNLTIAKDSLLTFARDDSSQAHIYRGWLVPDNRHEDYASIALMNVILGSPGLTSRLFLELRDKQGLAYNVRSTYESFRYKGSFYLYIGTEPKNREKCLEGFQQEIDKLVNIPVGEAELADAKRNMLGRRSVFLETAAQQANYIGTNYVLGRSLEEIEAIPAMIEAVTSADIQRISQTYLTQPSVTSLVAPSTCF